MVLDVVDLDLVSGGLASTLWFLPEYGPAVAGRGAISGRFRPGLMGAAEIPPWTLLELSALVRVVCGPVDEVVELDAFLTGDMAAIADPGRAGSVLAAKALF
jgi:hypothetical protein